MNTQIALPLEDPGNSETANGVAVPVERLVMYLYRVYSGKLKLHNCIPANRIKEWWENGFTTPSQLTIQHHPNDIDLIAMADGTLVSFECPYNGPMKFIDDEDT